ncbi:hypothetical protein FFF34_004005 [Inquilinus sp. KBS0705]|nr:hypothetical protein FFF34_004005 [Inquilinus sp. KBS0705]
MIRSIFTVIALGILLLLASCKQNKPKPVSKDINKTSVVVNGKKDSVINNSYKNYGNATVAEPCVKCLIQVIQNDAHYKQSIVSKPVNTIKYVVNWMPSEKADTAKRRGATSAIKVDVIDKAGAERKLSTFIYDNSLAKIYFVDYTANNTKIEVNTEANTLKRIRNSCYWGVSSSK